MSVDSSRFVPPYSQFCNEDGEPYAGGSVSFFVTATDTPTPVYIDSGLTISAGEVITLDAAGRMQDYWLSNQVAYKVVLKDADANIIWTVDGVWGPALFGQARFDVINGNPNGRKAGTAGTISQLPSSSIWDYVNNILYVCTTTGSATTAIWTAVNSSGSSSSASGAPGGYLTPSSGVPVITVDVTAATTVYYTPFRGATVPVYSGTAFTSQAFTELSLSLVASHAANTIYDVFVFNNSSVLTLVTGPAWTSSTAGAGARGTGAGTSQLALLSGINVNAVQITGRNGSTTYTIGANLATYLGSISIDSSAGQCSCYRTYGQARKWGIWNAYNRVPICLIGGDPTASWTYNTGTVRASNNDTNNYVAVFSGLAEEQYTVDFFQRTQLGSSASSTQAMQILIGRNAVLSTVGLNGYFGNNGSVVLSNAITSLTYTDPPSLGINTFIATEFIASTAGGTKTFFGTASYMLLRATWRG